jgi:integrase
VKRLENGQTKGRDVFFTAAESQRLVNFCEGPFRHLVTFGLLTGCRLGEAVQMRVRDFDHGRGQWDVALGKTGPRTCVLTQAAIDLLDRLTAGREKTALVFLRENGEPWNKSNIRLRMRPAIKRAKLDPTASFYTLRHSYISSQLNAGVPTLAIAQNVGTGVAMIEKHYGKFISDDRRKWLESGEIKLEVPPESKVVNIR